MAINKLSKFILNKWYFVLGFVLAVLPKSIYAFGTTACVRNGQEQRDTLATAFGCISTSGNALNNFVRTIYQYALFLGAALSIIMIVLGGVQYITSSGNPDSIESAKNRITSALWGFGLLVLAIIIFQTIGVGGGVLTQ
jgi:hypothetical protein